MRKMRLIAFVALGACLVAGGGYGWHRWRERQQAAIVRAAVPSIPELPTWPRPYVSRVREATAAAGRPEQAVAALGELALLYHANNSYREAAQAERGLHLLEAGNGRWTYYLADASEKLGDTDSQRFYLEQTVRIAPYYSPARLRLADLLLKLGYPDEARVHYERYLALVPNEPHGRLGLARIALERGDHNGAIKILTALIQDNPDFAAGHNLLAEVYASAGDTARADEQRRLSGATGEGQKVDDPWLDRLYAWSFDSFRIELAGGTEAQAKIVATSLPFYEKAVRLAPDDGQAYAALGGLLQQLNRLDDAAAVLQRGIAKAPRIAALYDTLAQVRRQQGRDADAREVLQRGIRADPTAAVLHSDLGSMLEKDGRRDEAVAAYRDAVRLDPRYAEAQWRLGLCLLAAGEVADAQVSLGHALDLQPRNADELVALAQKAIAAGQLDQARCCIHAVTEHSPGTPVRSLVEQALALAKKVGDEKATGDFAALLSQPLP
jgi:tetratricopeptide (TPR) repeat protein